MFRAESVRGCAHTPEAFQPKNRDERCFRLMPGLIGLIGRPFCLAFDLFTALFLHVARNVRSLLGEAALQDHHPKGFACGALAL